MAKKLDKYEVRARFERIEGISGEVLEMVMDLMDEDVGGFHEPGNLWRIGEGFSAVGSHLQSQAKGEMMPRLQGGRGDAASEVSGDVLFTYDPGFIKPLGAVDTAAVKKMFPVEEYPELYKASSRSEQIQAKG